MDTNTFSVQIARVEEVAFTIQNKAIPCLPEYKECRSGTMQAQADRGVTSAPYQFPVKEASELYLQGSEPLPCEADQATSMASSCIDNPTDEHF